MRKNTSLVTLLCIILLVSFVGCQRIETSEGAKNSQVKSSQEERSQELRRMVRDQDLWAMNSTKDGEVNSGDTAIMPNNYRVQVQNLNPIVNRTTHFSAGDYCDAYGGYVLTAIKVANQKVLVDYRWPYEAEGLGCPNGVQFFVSEKEFMRMTDTYHTLGVIGEGRYPDKEPDLTP